MWYKLSIEEIARKLRSNINAGLSENEVKERLEKCGKNKIKEKKKTSIFSRFIKQFNDFMIIILIIAAVTSAVMAYVQKTGEYVDSVIIIGIVVFNAIVGLIQETRAEKSLEALAKMASPTAKVRRNGIIKEIASEEVVPGDIIILETGNFVPADSRVIKSYSLAAEESILTGETLPANKENTIINKEKTNDADICNMVFSGTLICAGHGEAIVCKTGMNTKVGQIAKLIVSNEAPQTPLQKKLRRS